MRSDILSAFFIIIAPLFIFKYNSVLACNSFAYLNKSLELLFNHLRYIEVDIEDLLHEEADYLSLVSLEVVLNLLYVPLRLLVQRRQIFILLLFLHTTH